MSPLVLGLWAANIVCDTVGQLSFKAAAGSQRDGGWRLLARQPLLWLGIACYVGEFLAWIAFLSLVPLGEGMLLASVNIVGVMVGGRLLFGERLTALRTSGVLLIAAGVALVGAG